MKTLNTKHSILRDSNIETPFFSSEDSLTFFQSLFSHLCHDLVSPLSALSGGLELFEDQKMTAEEVFPILSKSLDTLRWRLEIMRASVGLNGHKMSLVRAFHVASSYLAQSKKIQLLWELRGSIEETHTVAQIVLSGILWMASRAPKGMGVLSVKEENQEILLILHAPMVLLSEEEKSILLKKTVVEHDPLLSFTQYLVRISEKQGFRIELKSSTREELYLAFCPQRRVS